MTNQMKEYALPRSTLTLMTALIVISTILFAIGILIERTGEAGEVPGVHTEVQGDHQGGNVTEAAHNESNEGGEASEGHTETSVIAATTVPVVTSAEDTHAETILGINIENPAFVIAAVVVWLALAIGLWLFGKRVLIPVIIVALGTALFDGLEIITQINRSNTGIALLAALITIMHLAVAEIACRILLSKPSTQLNALSHP